MCTLIALHRCFPEAPLVIAANRDEYLDRPAEGPALRRVGPRTVVAPRDARAGGTWLGLNDAGLFAGITNRPSRGPDPTRRSRGLLVADALACETAAEAAALLARLPAGAYNPFNLFVTDGREAFAAVYEKAPRVSALAPGAHVIGNVDPDARDVPKVARLLAAAERVAEGPALLALDALAAVCRTHGAGLPLDDTCIHAGGYGTRSSTLLRRGTDPQADELRFADGPPCQQRYDDLTPLLRELDRRASIAKESAERTVA
jgi:uncharacterized protein with NRDE domain